MQKQDGMVPKRVSALFALSAGAALVLSACGGGGGAADAAGMAAAASTTTATFTIAAATMAADVGTEMAQPAFHLAPVVLDEPDDADAANNDASASVAAHRQAIPAEARGLDTRGLTVEALQDPQRVRALAAKRLQADGALAPLAAMSAVSTYTPAQIRAAYGLPVLPSAGLTPTAAQAAQLGAGQTIYIIDAQHDPNVAAELAAFNAKFGLPACTTKPIAVGSALPIAPANAADGCTLSVVYSTVNGTMTSVAPAFDAGWATEIALDVQWAHATAPLARIVLIESADAALNGLLGGVKLANAMGAGVVSMSFGAPEGNWTASVDPAFAAPGMSYLAATGDSGSGVSWPAVSPTVLAVGGTSLAYGGSGARSETSWSRTGGGISAYTATPVYQSSSVPGVGTLARRAVADVAFNADPSTGQFVALMAPGNSSVSWVSAGGTSLSTPQWAGVLAVANAVRAQTAQARLGAPHAALYTGIASVPGSYAAAFADILTGSNGSCASCGAHVGYDIPTGLGTPNVGALLTRLAGPTPTPAPVAPVVASATVNGNAGMPLSYSVGVSAASATGFALTGAPAGMTISSAGAVAWANPIAGSYAVTVTAVNAASGLSGKGVLTVVIAKAQPPVVNAPALTGVVGKALTGAITFSDPAGSALSITISGVPAGVSFTPSGPSLLLNWAKPVAGKYALAITARNAAGLSTAVSMAITVNAK